MNKNERICLFFVLILILGVIIYSFNSELDFNSTQGTIIYTSLLMMAFSTMLMEHFFTKPADVLASAISIVLTLAPIGGQIGPQLGIWYEIFLFYNGLLIFTSVVSLFLVDSHCPETDARNVVAKKLKLISTKFGKSKLLFFLLTVLMTLSYVNTQSGLFICLFLYGLVVMVIEPNKLFWNLFLRKEVVSQSVGNITSILSNTLYEVVFNKGYQPVPFGSYLFKYSEDTAIQNATLFDVNPNGDSNVGRLLVVPGAVPASPRGIEVKRIYISSSALPVGVVGIVSAGTQIDKVKFEPSELGDLWEGDLVSIELRDHEVLYQVVNSTVTNESLDHGDEKAKTVAEAIQIGTWDNQNYSFNKFGWNPRLHAPVRRAVSSIVSGAPADYFQVGTIPKTNYPVLLHKEYAITHHLAILGVTGVGKSVFTRNLIRNLVSADSKFICIDFTGEYRNKFNNLNPVDIVNTANQTAVYGHIATITTELAKFSNQQNQMTIKNSETAIENIFDTSISNYLQGTDVLSILELPDLSNTSEIFDYTRRFFKSLFKVAKANNSFDKKVCVVLEEAHTVIPEWNSSGASDRSAQHLVNSISQIALQGRKYNIGFFVIAQRTANVSKTILTQCNSIIAFKQFDKTSAEFLTSFVGSELVTTLSRLKNRQAIAVGKAFKSNIPMIFEVPNITE